jgi:hypothetical protein
MVVQQLSGYVESTVPRRHACQKQLGRECLMPGKLFGTDSLLALADGYR